MSATRRAPEAPSRDLVGVDVGGTFTDVVAVDPDSGAVRVLKVPTTPADQSDGVLAGIAGLRGECRHMVRLAHGTTVATNALLEGTGARVALVTSAGFRDTLEIGRCRRMVPDTMFDTKFVRPAPLVPRRLRFEIPERLDRHGRVRVPLDEAALAAAAETMADERVEAVAVCFLHAYANAAHETRAAEILAKRLPDAVICTSAEVLPELREFERFSTAAINASLAPVMGRYVRALVRELETRGHDGDLYTMASGGGVMNSATTIAYPVRTILSGPASGVNGAVFVSRLAGRRDLVTCDMGGTSTDVCLVENLAPVITTEGVVNGLPVKTPQVEIHTVGAGGGSIAWLDVDGALRVGPRSAGAVPGPACYGQGGDAATVTDANLFLGRLSPALLDGGLPLRPELARAALARLADALGRPGDIEWIAEGIVDLGVATTASAIRKVSIQRGHDPRRFTLVAMGGAGPMHGVQVASELAIGEVLIPPWPGNISALGLLAADIVHDDVRTLLGRADEIALATLEAAYDDMESAGRRTLAEEGVGADSVILTRQADLRYAGQAFEVMVDAPRPLSIGGLTEAFHAAYRRRYGHDQDEAVELVNLRLRAAGVTRKPVLPTLAQGRREALGAARPRPACFAGKWHDTPVVRREALGAGDVLDGPLIVEEFGTTTVVPPGWTLRAEESAALAIRPSAGGAR